jgi:hypothetical protein
MKNHTQYVPNVHFEKIPIKNLVSDQKYQRKLSPSHIQRMAQNFDLRQVNPVKVSRRDGKNYVFNGQHTIECVAAVSASSETPVWCMVYDDLEYAQEADIFANQQKYVRALSPYDVFMGNVEAGNDEQLMIKDLVESCGLQVASGRKQGGVCALATLEYIYRHYGFQVLQHTLHLCIGTWEGEPDSLSANMLRGVSRLVAAFGDSMKDDVFKEKVGKDTARKIGRYAKERGAGALSYAEVMLDIYNKQMKAPLQRGKLHAAKFAVLEKGECQ